MNNLISIERLESKRLREMRSDFQMILCLNLVQQNSKIGGHNL